MTLRSPGIFLLFFLSGITGCTLPYAIPWATDEVKNKIKLEELKEKPDELLQEFFPRKIKELRQKIEEGEKQGKRLRFCDAYAFLGLEEKDFQEIPEQLKADLQLPENLTGGWTTEQIVLFTKRMRDFRERWTQVADVRKYLYLGFPKYFMERKGYNQEIRIITDGEYVFNIITPGGVLFPERHGEYWWKFSGDLFRGAISGVGEQGGKEVVRKGKKLIF